MTKNEIIELVEAVHKLDANENNSLPENSYFLDDTSVLCYPRKYGDSRYPYYCSGLVLFAHTSGYIDCVQGRLNIFRCQHYNEDTPIAFYAGESRGEEFFPFSVTGAARQLFEPSDLTRYVVFKPKCAYYITEKTDAIYALRVSVDEEKHLHFSFGAVNRGRKRNIYLASFFEPMMSYDLAENFYHRMIKYGEHFSNGSYIMYSRNNTCDCLTINRAVTGNVTKKYFTTAKRMFLGLKGANLTNAIPLKNGYFDEEINKTNTTDVPCASDIIHFSFAEDDFVSINYEIYISDEYNEAESYVSVPVNTEEIDKNLFAEIIKEKETFKYPDFRFNKWKNSNLNGKTTELFLKQVERQVSFCALGENYAGSMLGIRDVFQQLETSLIWQTAESKKQIVRVMNYILEDGRAPRQISFPTKEKPIPDMDLRPFIDQGFWIISALHTYLAYTDDISILDEECGYYKAKATFGPLELSSKKDSLLCHIIRITDYLISNTDEKTQCVHALWGDWNDAIDGFGKTQNKNREFGDGVSVMATEQLYLALGQVCEILKCCKKFPELQEKYTKIRQNVSEGFYKYAVDNHNGEKRIIHGWGENRSFFAGSFHDCDGESRISLTSNAYCAVSGLVNKFPDLREHVYNNIMALDSVYGLKTFDKPFTGKSKSVGRISTITPGTFENAAAYVHAGTFGVMALFIMGYAEEAWRMLEKCMPLFYDKVTKTSFIMPNSYSYSEEYSAFGDSMNDWYTGSGTVLIKNIIRYGFGIIPALDGLIIAPPEYFPSEEAAIKLVVKGIEVSVEYKTAGKWRNIFINGEEFKPKKIENDFIERIFIPKEKLTTDIKILIED